MNTVYPMPANPFAEPDPAQPDAPTLHWRPKWTVDVGDGCTLGLTVDDGCFIVLCQHGNSWRPGKHVPPQAARKMGELVAAGVLD